MHGDFQRKNAQLRLHDARPPGRQKRLRGVCLVT
jgi:hypothetical protein